MTKNYLFFAVIHSCKITINFYDYLVSSTDSIFFFGITISEECKISRFPLPCCSYAQNIVNGHEGYFVHCVHYNNINCG